MDPEKFDWNAMRVKSWVPGVEHIKIPEKRANSSTIDVKPMDIPEQHATTIVVSETSDNTNKDDLRNNVKGIIISRVSLEGSSAVGRTKVDYAITDQEHSDDLLVLIHLEHCIWLQEKLVMKLAPTEMYINYNTEIVLHYRKLESVLWDVKLYTVIDPGHQKILVKTRMEMNLEWPSILPYSQYTEAATIVMVANIVMNQRKTLSRYIIKPVVCLNKMVNMMTVN